MTHQKKDQQLKEYVKNKYSEIAQKSEKPGSNSGCGVPQDLAGPDYTVFSDDYSEQEGYDEDSDLGLGCGIPTEGAHIREGDTVLDLGSGAGNDCFVARRMTGEKGKVIGIDFSEAMVKKAKANAEKLGYENVEFLLGDIERMPINKNSIDVILSNCVLNLVPEKQRAFDEMYRVLKPLTHFSVSDVVIHGDLPEGLKEDAALYAGCVSGAQEEEDYLDGIRKAGFKDLEIVKRKHIEIPDDLLSQYLSEEEIERFRNGDVGVHSITVRGVKSTFAGLHA